MAIPCINLKNNGCFILIATQVIKPLSPTPFVVVMEAATVGHEIEIAKNYSMIPKTLSTMRLFC